MLLDKNGQPFNPQTEPSKILWKEYAVIPKESLTFDTRNLFIASLNFIQPLFMGGKIIAYNKIARLKTDLSNYEADECNEKADGISVGFLAFAIFHPVHNGHNSSKIIQQNRSYRRIP